MQGPQVGQRFVAREAGSKAPLKRAVRLGHDSKIGLRPERLRQLSAGDLHVQVEDVRIPRRRGSLRLGPEGRRRSFQKQPLINLVADHHAAIELEAVVRSLHDLAVLVEPKLKRLAERAILVRRHTQHVFPRRSQGDELRGVDDLEDTRLRGRVERIRLGAHEVAGDVGIGARRCWGGSGRPEPGRKLPPP